MGKRLTKKQREMFEKNRRKKRSAVSLYVMPDYAMSFEQAEPATAEQVNRARNQLRRGESVMPTMWIVIGYGSCTIDDMRIAERDEILGNVII